MGVFTELDKVKGFAILDGRHNWYQRIVLPHFEWMGSDKFCTSLSLNICLGLILHVLGILVNKSIRYKEK